MSAQEDDDASEKPFEAKVPMLSFEREIFINMFENDALLVMAKGLNYNTILTNLLWVYNDKSNLVFVINASDFEEKYYSSKLNLPGLPALGPDRAKLYLEGGVHFASSRVLVVDLLKNRVPIEHVTGVIVMRAHTILESCQEAFALRLYRQKNKTGFVKGFSNSPISFTYGYGHVEKVMRSLFVIELFLWPRFHGSVIKCLKRREAKVTEIFVSLSEKVTLIQTCLLDIINYVIKQLKATNKELNMQEITTENCLTKKFHKILQSQLDTVWHQLSTRTKEHVQDLRVLRYMLINLIHDDAVSLHALVCRYRSPEYAKVNSGWILLDSAEQLFKLARSRVFNSKKEFDPEPCPKWKTLSELLKSEIPTEVKSKKGGSLKNTKILILCQDNRTCSQLNQYLTMGPEKYLMYMALRREIPINQVASKFKVNAKVPGGKSKEFPSKTFTKGTNSKADVSGIPADEDENNDDVLEKDEDIFFTDEEARSEYVLTLTQVAAGSSGQGDDTVFEPFTQLEDIDLTTIDSEDPLIYIKTFKEDGNYFSLDVTLETIKPQYIIMYHSDSSAIRQIEVYENRKLPDEPTVSVYFIIHNQTVEEQAYLTNLKKEKQAFEHLIQTKSTMVIPKYQDGKSDEVFTMNELPIDEDNADSRKAGASSGVKERPMVVVDTREFRSDLPALLHKRGIDIQPVTITIGDYILTPDLCVERKSLSDLIGSLNSGRLFTQATNMCRAYSRPILLIEFDQNKPFNLQGNFMSKEMSGADIQQKLQLLTIHFPKLKLVWSPSPYATAELFYELKQGRKNPSIADSLEVGDEMSWERYNNDIYDFMLKLPGVNSKNIIRLMSKGVSLDHLITLTKEQMCTLIENKNDGESLYTILHTQFKPNDIASKEEKYSSKRKYTSRIFNKKKKES